MFLYNGVCFFSIFSFCYLFFLLLLRSFCYPLDFFAALCVFIYYPLPDPSVALDISSVVRFCQTTFATARTTIVIVHTPRLSGGAQVGIWAKVAREILNP